MAQDDDNFGLPDLNFKPLEPKKQTPPPPPPPPKVEKKPVTPAATSRVQTAGTPTKAIPRPGQKVEEKSNTSVIIGIAVPILLLVGGYFGYLYLYKKPKEKAAQEAAIAKAAADKLKQEQEEAARLAKLKEEEEARLKAAAEAKPANGTTEMLTAPTGRFYVIVASSIDDDLLMDEAQRMSAKGVSTKIVPPFGKWKYFRLTISDHDTFALAQASADEAKVQYPGGTWVLRY
jgi:type IV secretory pathway VirB10-like protein